LPGKDECRRFNRAGARRGRRAGRAADRSRGNSTP
jgi:hypothetical protein